MSRLLPALVLAALLAIAGVAVVNAQTSTPTPEPLLPAPTAAPTSTPPADYEAQALVQLGNLRNCAADMYQINVTTDTLDSCFKLLLDEIDPFAYSTTPPPAFAPFQMRLFMSVRPCWRANNVIRTRGKDPFWFLTAAMDTQACYSAASDASVEWARVTGTVPVFQAPTSTPTADAPVAAATPAAIIDANVDDLGLSWQLTNATDPQIELEDWSGYKSQNGYFAAAGRLRNLDPARRFSLASIMLKFYDIAGNLVAAEDNAASGHWVEPGEFITFTFDTYTKPDGIASYTIEILGSDWQE